MFSFSKSLFSSSTAGATGPSGGGRGGNDVEIEYDFRGVWSDTARSPNFISDPFDCGGDPIASILELKLIADADDERAIVEALANILVLYAGAIPIGEILAGDLAADPAEERTFGGRTGSKGEDGVNFCTAEEGGKLTGRR